MSKWDERFLTVAFYISCWSKDPGTKVGCVLVKDRRIIATGYNGFPAGIADDPDRYLDRDYKLAAVVHAEKNALFNAAKNGSEVEGATAYVTFPPCSQCSSALIQAGVSEVYAPNPLQAPLRWQSNFLIGRSLLEEAGVSVQDINWDFFDGNQGMCDLRGQVDQW